MDILTKIRQHDELTSSEAIMFSYLFAEKYIAILMNILRIKQKVPIESETQTFRVKQDNTALIQGLVQVLKGLEKELNQLETQLQQLASQGNMDE